MKLKPRLLKNEKQWNKHDGEHLPKLFVEKEKSDEKKNRQRSQLSHVLMVEVNVMWIKNPELIFTFLLEQKIMVE